MSCTELKPRTVRYINLKTKKEKFETYLGCHMIASYEETEDETHYISISTTYFNIGGYNKNTVKTRKDGKNSRQFIRNWRNVVPQSYVRLFTRLVAQYGEAYPFIDFSAVAALMGIPVNADWYWPNNWQACEMEITSNQEKHKYTNSESFVLYEHNWQEYPNASYWTKKTNRHTFSNYTRPW